MSNKPNASTTQLDDRYLEAVQTSAPDEAPRIVTDLNQLYEDIIYGIEPFTPLVSKAMEYLNRWTLNKLSTEDTLANLDAIGYLDWELPASYLEQVNRLDVENEE